MEEIVLTQQAELKRMDTRWVNQQEEQAERGKKNARLNKENGRLKRLLINAQLWVPEEGEVIGTVRARGEGEPQGGDGSSTATGEGAAVSDPLPVGGLAGVHPVPEAEKP